jgi:membrane protease YdiL (CAAX protease family)
MHKETTSPFEKVRARSFIWWFLAGLLILIPAIIVLSKSEILSSTFVYLWLDALMVLWVLRQISKNGISLKKFFLNRSREINFRTISLSILTPFCLAAFSLGSTMMVGYLLARFFPQIAQNLFSPTQINTVMTLGEKLIQVFFGVLAAPIIEETFFRGMLLERFSLKWKISTAIIVSAIFFAIPHLPNVFGAFIFGMAMSLLYFKTKTLIAPMISHFINNLITIAGPLFIFAASATSEGELVEELKSGLPFAIVLVVISLPYLVYFFIKNWPRKDTKTPYNA